MYEIRSITALKDTIRIETSLTLVQKAEVYACPSYEDRIIENGVRLDTETQCLENGVLFTVARYDGGRDRQYLRFTVLAGGERLGGPCCVGETVSRWDYVYPSAPTIKGLQVREVADALALGVHHAALNISQPTVMLLHDDGEAIPFESQGRIFYFRRKAIEEFDRDVGTLTNNGVVVNLILLNALKWQGEQANEELAGILQHPDYDSEGLISAFNTVSRDGVDYYLAFVEFLAERYMNPDGINKPACGLIIANEVDSQWVWSNAGKKTVRQFVRQYSDAMRLSCLAARKMYASARIYVSLDNFWTVPYIDDELKCYHARDILELLNENSHESGDYPWGVAYHPYPENIEKPDFWNDTKAEYNFGTKRMTFKNIEILCEFLRQPEFLYRGSPRPLILSEQGFNSLGTLESEKLQSAAYCLAYRKLEMLPQIEAFILHAHVDNKDEFGLNLGIRHRDASSASENEPGVPKPIYFVFRDIDDTTKTGVCDEARNFIGEKIWNDILQIREIKD